MTPKLIIVLLFLIFVTLPVFATESSSNIQVSGDAGTVMISMMRNVEVASEGIGATSGNINTETSNRKILTLGYSEVDINDTSNNRYHNTLDSSDSVSYDDQALISDSYSMGDIKDSTGKYSYLNTLDESTSSRQHVAVDYTQMGSGGGRYKSAAVIDDANMTTSMRAEGNHGGSFTIYESKSEAGLAAGSDTVNFVKEERGEIDFMDKNGTGFGAQIDWTWRDHSVPFEVIENETNVSPIVSSNSTMGNVFQ